MDKIEIINRIGYIRVRAKLTQKALSNALGMNPSYINRLECQKDFLPSVEVLMNIIEVCGSTPEEFFYHDITAYERDCAIKEKLDSLPSEVREFVLDCNPDLMDIFIRLNAMVAKSDK